MKKIIIFALLLAIVGIAFCKDLTLDLMFTNDLHGGIDRYEATFINPDFPPRLGGGGSAATYINRVRSKATDSYRSSLLIDAGDFFQGRPVGTVSDGRNIIDYMNMIGYDLTVIGNHEFDIGEERLIETYKRAEFPILSCNVISRETNEIVDYAIPYIIVNKMNLKIGIIGVTTTDTEKMSFPEHIKNVKFAPAKPAVEKYVKLLREEKNVDLVFVVGHMGLPYRPEPAYEKRYLENDGSQTQYWGYDAQQIAHEVEGIDVFFGGHMHKGFSEPWEDPDTHTLVVQGYAYGSGIGHLILQIDSETKSISGYDYPAIQEKMLVTLFEDEFIPEKDVSTSILEMQKEAEKGMDDIIGTAGVYLSKHGTGAQNIIGNVICEAIQKSVQADFAFINLGSTRDEIALGPISYRDVFNVMPFDNQLVYFEVSGKVLKDILETRVAGGRHGLRVSGIEVVFSKTRPDFDRVTKLLIGGENWDPQKIYRIATSDFLLQGNAGLTLLTKIPEEQITRPAIGMRDAVVDYIRRNSPIVSEIDNRWKRDDKSKPTKELLDAFNSIKD